MEEQGIPHAGCHSTLPRTHQEFSIYVSFFLILPQLNEASLLYPLQMGNTGWTKLPSRKKRTCPSQELKGQLNCYVLGLIGKRLEGYLFAASVCMGSGGLGHSLSEHLLWNFDLDMNVVVAIAIAINPGDAFSRQANPLVGLNPRRDLLRKECTDVPWFPLSKNKTTQRKTSSKKDLHRCAEPASHTVVRQLSP